MTEVLSPVTEEVVATVPAATREETDAAIARAAAAFEGWRAVTPGDGRHALHDGGYRRLPWPP